MKTNNATLRMQDVLDAINSAPELPEKRTPQQTAAIMQCITLGVDAVDYMLRIAEKKMKIEIRTRIEALNGRDEGRAGSV